MSTIRTRYLPAAAALMWIATPAGAALLTPIDDCEVGAFSIQNNQGTELQSSIPLPGAASHTIASQRVVKIAAAGSQGPYTYASLTPGPGDSYLSLDIANFGYADVDYDWGAPEDLTFGGTMQWIEMDVAAPHPGDQVTMTIRDGVSQTTASRFLQFGSRETLIWNASSLNASVLCQATSITFHFHPGGGPNGTDFQVYDIRFRTTGSTAVTMAGTSVSVQTPPVPSAPLAFTPFEQSQGSPLYDANVAIADAMTTAMTVPAADWTWAKTTGAGGEWAEMSYLWTEPGGVQETDFQVSVDLSQVDGGYVPEVYPPDPVHDPDSILLHFPVALRASAGGTVQAVSDTWLSLDIVEGQGLELQNVSVTPNAAAASLPDGFTLSFRMQLASAGSTSVQSPLFTAAWISDFSTQVTTGAMPPNGAPEPAEALRLVAAPSITRGGTELRASRPFERAAAVLIHDVTGRVVRRLEAARGARSVGWDGTTDDGRPTAAGVYFVRAAGETSAGTRIVRLR